MESQRNQIAKDWQALGPKDRMIMFEKLMRFVLPATQNTLLQSDFECAPVVIFELNERFERS